MCLDPLLGFENFLFLKQRVFNHFVTQSDAYEFGILCVNCREERGCERLEFFLLGYSNDGIATITGVKFWKLMAHCDDNAQGETLECMLKA